MDQQQRIEELIDELYAVQKQAGDRMVELTNENKWILDKQERNVTRSIDDVRKYSKILVGVTLAICIVGGTVLGWKIYNYKRALNAVLQVIYRNVIEIKDNNKEIKKILEEVQKGKSSSENLGSTKKEKGYQTTIILTGRRQL